MNEEPGIRCWAGPEGPRPFNPDNLSDKEYYEWLKKQPLSKKEYNKLFFARLKRKKINYSKIFVKGRNYKR